MIDRWRDWWAYRSFRCMVGLHDWVQTRSGKRGCRRVRCQGQVW